MWLDMTITKTFFVREIVRLRHNIASLERGLNGYSPTDPRSTGQRDMLDNEKKCREYLLDLAGQIADLTDLQLTLRIQYGLAKREHERCRERRNGQRVASQCDDWWQSLGKMQYLCHLSQSLETLMRSYTVDECHAELKRVTASKDLASAALRSELMHAMARAEGSSVDKEYLVRHDVRLPHPNGSSPNGKPPGDTPRSQNGRSPNGSTPK